MGERGGRETETGGEREKVREEGQRQGEGKGQIRDKRKIEEEREPMRDEIRERQRGRRKRQSISSFLQSSADIITPSSVVVCCSRAALWNRVSHPQRRFTPRRIQYVELCCRVRYAPF